MAPVKAMCQTFQMSMLMVFVVFVANMMRLMAMESGMAMVATIEPHVAPDMPGQPTSTIERLTPRRSAMAWAAGPIWAFIMSTMRPIPTKPTPIMRPERMALPGLIPMQTDRIAMMIGSMTDAPMSMM